jgi:hypothetical protein
MQEVTLSIRHLKLLEDIFGTRQFTTIKHPCVALLYRKPLLSKTGNRIPSRLKRLSFSFFILHFDFAFSAPPLLSLPHENSDGVLWQHLPQSLGRRRSKAQGTTSRFKLGDTECRNRCL